ncbi:MAG: DNA repair protein RadA [Elusimicrobia bacterium]|nr:DNA repair protein RadA [Elusimicrobiota bacterium]MBI3013133.1 DNA repair protein RadA [Elusimicrobiota bacterium]
MSKSKTIFRCRECGYSTAKWLGKCPDCGQWNSLEEEKMAVPSPLSRRNLTDFTSTVSLLSDVSTQNLERVSTGMAELDRMIGGGLVSGSLILVGGPPGIGKSTLVLQIASHLGKGKKVLYVSGEESQEQVKSRAERLGVQSAQFYLLSETSLETILENLRTISPEYLVIDSIQTTYLQDFASAPGSVGQIRECTAELLRCAKSLGITVFLLGHVTKEGDLAGPRLLEHMVDTVLYFESEPQQNYRILRAHKNRFGPTSEIALFEMKSAGLFEVPNPSQIFLQQRHPGAGSVIVTTMEGTRPLLLEVQALVSRTHFGLPRRMVTAVDFNRVLLMIAVLEKRVGLSLQSQDIFVNVTGGAKLKETSVDLGICCAIASAFGNFSAQSDGAVIGEVGLGGEVRIVPHIGERLKEAQRLGLSWAIVPKKGFKGKESSNPITVVPVETVQDAVYWLRKNISSAGLAESVSVPDSSKEASQI